MEEIITFIIGIKKADHMILLSMDIRAGISFTGEEYFIRQSDTVAKQNMVLLAISNDFPFWLHINLRTSKLAACKRVV